MPSIEMRTPDRRNWSVQAKDVNWAVSTGRRNTTILFHYHELVQRLCGRPPTERFSRSAVQRDCDGLEIIGAVLAEIRAFREGSTTAQRLSGFILHDLRRVL